MFGANKLSEGDKLEEDDGIKGMSIALIAFNSLKNLVVLSRCE